MPYTIKSIYYTLQGEGAQAGRPAVFCRFSGCNLWNGVEADRADAVCDFCDTDIIGIDGAAGGEYGSAAELADAVAGCWPEDASPHLSSPRGRGNKFVVLTGGEPLLQFDAALGEALHGAGFEIAVETNGTLPLETPVDWLCVSPKAQTRLRLTAGDELKLVYPQTGIEPAEFESLDFRHFFLQPMDGPNLADNTKLALDYCLRRPRWRLSTQRHKLWGLA